MRGSELHGQWMREADGNRWWFDSGSIALDFAHTGGFAHGPGMRQTGELLINAADLDGWLAERYPNLDGGATERDLKDALSLRAAIAGLTRAIADGHLPEASDIDIVNLYAATPDIPPSLLGGSRRAGRQRARVAQGLATLARDAIAVLGEREPGRIRECTALDCDLVFIDDSRSNNRRWCSMQRCGNRAKVRAHRQRATA